MLLGGVIDCVCVCVFSIEWVVVLKDALSVYFYRSLSYIGVDCMITAKPK